MQKPIPAIPLQSDSTRPITPEEKNHYFIMQEIYTQKVAADKCNRKLYAHLQNINEILTTGQIATL